MAVEEDQPVGAKRMTDQVIQLRLPNGPLGYRLVQLTDWIGKAFVIPRPSLRDFAARPESGEPGLYFLFGDPSGEDAPSVYIGESGRQVLNRLFAHDAQKNFWHTAIVFTGNLDSTKVKFLESLAISEAARLKNYLVQNKVEQTSLPLSEFDEVTARSFFTKIQYLLSVLGFPLFEDVKTSLETTVLYFLKSSGADARAQLLEDGRLNVLSGSRGRVAETNTFGGWSKRERERLLENGSLTLSSDGLHFESSQDLLFKSPSAAAATFTGSSINGWTAWKDSAGKTLDENLRTENS